MPRTAVLAVLAVLACAPVEGFDEADLEPPCELDVAAPLDVPAEPEPGEWNGACIGAEGTVPYCLGGLACKAGVCLVP